jgi:HEPN domain-containing protein
LSTELLIASHLRLANEAVEAARSLLRDGNRNAVYNAEQAVEMIVLALAQSEAVHYSRTQQHQLDTMVRGLPADKAFTSDLSDLTWLEAYATAFRYPCTKGGISDAPPPENWPRRCQRRRAC